MSWGTKRRNFILFIIFLLVVIPTGYLLFKIFYHPPTCFDKKQNGTEAGIDCGGECALICEKSARDAVVLWKRFFPVSEGVYNVIAMVENSNPDAGIDSIPYSFKLYDRENILLTEREGSVRIPPNKTLPVVETGLMTGKLIPRRIAFDFTEEFNWGKDFPVEPVLIIKEQKIVNEDIAPRINAVMTNTRLQTVYDIDVVAIVYDNADNAIGSASTYIEEAKNNERVNIVFTWSVPFESPISRVEIIPLYETI